jgi:hypothetical protein
MLGTLLLDDIRPSRFGLKLTIQREIEDALKTELTSTTVDEILLGSKDHKILKIGVDGLDFDTLGARWSLESGTICSVLTDAADNAQSEISAFLSEFNFVSHQRFNEVASHSDGRRIAAGKVERNRVYSRLEVI